jgi:hypothetical protein
VEVEFYCSYGDTSKRFRLSLPDTLYEFYRLILEPYDRAWNAEEFLIHYYDETVNKYIDLNEKNWLQYSNSLKSQLLSGKQPCPLSYSAIVRAGSLVAPMIAHLAGESTRSSSSYCPVSKLKITKIRNSSFSYGFQSVYDLQRNPLRNSKDERVPSSSGMYC